MTCAAIGDSVAATDAARCVFAQIRHEDQRQVPRLLDLPEVRRQLFKRRGRLELGEGGDVHGTVVGSEERDPDIRGRTKTAAPPYKCA